MERTSVEALQNEVEFYRGNQTVVEAEIRTLIADNQKLSHQVGMLLKEKMERARDTHSDFAGKELEDLRGQITLLTKERNSLHVLWQTSQKTIEALEMELKTYQSYETREKQQRYATDDRRDLELKLETSLSDYIEIETKYKELRTKYTALENELKSRDKEIDSYKERGKEMEAKLDEVVKELDEFRINLAAEKKNNEDLRSQLLNCQKESVAIVKREAEAKSKVAEALQLYDTVCVQKKEANNKIAEMTNEMIQTKKALLKVKHEAESNFRKEIDELRDKYNEKIADMLQHMRNLDQELVEKGVLFNRALRENKILHAANESHLKQQNDCLQSVEPKLALADQRLEAMFQELTTSERRNVALVCEKQTLAIDIQRIQDTHSREIKRRDWEEKLLNTRCEELGMQVEHLQKSLEETHGMITKLQAMLASRTELNLKMVSTKEEELAELNKHLENQMELNKKWKESYVLMTEKLKKKLEDLQKENRDLRIKFIGSSSYKDDSSS